MAKAERAPQTAPERAPERAQVQHELLGLSHAQLLELHNHMLTARILDERMWALNRQGKAPFVVSSAGHEGCQIGSAYALIGGSDFFVPYYRDLGVVLVAGLTMRDVLLGVYAKAGGSLQRRPPDAVALGMQATRHHLRVVADRHPGTPCRRARLLDQVPP